MISLFIEDLENLLRVRTCFGLEDHIEKLIDKWKQIEELRLKSVKEEQSKCHYCQSTSILDDFKYKKNGNVYCSAFCYEKEKKEQSNNVIFPAKISSSYPDDLHYETPESVKWIKKHNEKKEQGTNKKSFGCKITDNAKNGQYDDHLEIVAQLCSGDCDNCPHKYEIKEQEENNKDDI